MIGHRVCGLVARLSRLRLETIDGWQLARADLWRGSKKKRIDQSLSPPYMQLDCNKVEVNVKRPSY